MVGMWKYVPTMPEPMMELMKLNAAIGMLLRCCCCCSFSSSASSSARCDVRSLRDVRVDSGLSGIDYGKHKHTVQCTLCTGHSLSVVSTMIGG